MSEIARLRRTVRRCTAVLVAAVGIHLAGIPGFQSEWSWVLVALSVLYLLVSGFDQFAQSKQSRENGTPEDQEPSRGTRSGD